MNLVFIKHIKLPHPLLFIPPSTAIIKIVRYYQNVTRLNIESLVSIDC